MKHGPRWLALRESVRTLCRSYGDKKALSNVLGVPQTTLSKILHGPHEPRAEIALALQEWATEQGRQNRE